MLVAMARDLRVLMIKLADRLHNMRTLDYLPADRAKKIAQETLDIYAPLAHRLGMAKVKAELEDLALRTLNPTDYVDLQKRVAKRRLEREADINQVIAILQRQARRGRDRLADPRPAQALLLDLEEDARPGPRVRRDLRPHGRPRHHRVGPRLLRRARRHPLALEAGPRTLQGLHRDAQGQHVPVAPHDGDRAQGRSAWRSRSAPARCTASPRKASPRTGSTRSSKAGRDKLDESLVWLRQLIETQQDTEGSAGVHGHRAGRSCSRTRCTSSRPRAT